MKRCNVGGQAVMEGVMMKSEDGIAMAVRRADGKIVADFKPQTTRAKKGTFLGLPVVRGVVTLFESLSTGLSTTMDSAKMYGVLGAALVAASGLALFFALRKRKTEQ